MDMDEIRKRNHAMFANKPATKIIKIRTVEGEIIDVKTALTRLSRGESLNKINNSVVQGIYSDGRETSLKCRNDGFYYMSGNYCSDATG